MRALLWGLFFSCAFPVLAAEQETWVAVGYGGRRIVSTDGQKWEITGEWAQPGNDDSNNLIDAVFAQGKFVAVGGGGGGKTAGGHVLVSPDGRTWTETWKAPGRISPIEYGNDRFVVGGPNRTLYWSKDAVEWTPGAKIDAKEATHFRHGAFGNGLFIFVGNHGGNGAQGWAAVSPDGEKITHYTNELVGHGRMAFGAGRFLMLTSHSNADLLATTDGVKWEPVVVAEGAKHNWLVWTGSEFMTGEHKAAYRSADGVTWTKLDVPSRASVLWSDGTRSITTSWPGKMGFSVDGKTWEMSPKMTENGINQVVFGVVK